MIMQQIRVGCFGIIRFCNRIAGTTRQCTDIKKKALNINFFKACTQVL